LIFIGYTLSTKQYRLYNPKTRKLVTSRDVVFHEDCPFYKPLEQQIFCPTTVNDSRANVTFATGGDADFFPVEDDVESLSSDDDFGHIVGSEEESGEEDNGEREGQDFEEVIRTPPLVVKKTPKSQLPGQMKNTLGGYWKGSASGLRPIRKSTGGAGRSSQATSIDLALLVADGPRTITDALDGPNRRRWIEAINSELLSLEGHKTWSEVQGGKLPVGSRAISSRMVLQKKIGEDGKVARYKARLVAHGFRQREGIDYLETYSPTISFAAIRTVLSKAAMEDKEIIKLDIVTAFLESKVEEELYLRLPKEFCLGKNGNVILQSSGVGLEVSGTVQVNRGLYGLKQAGRNWYNMLEMSFIRDMRMQASKFEAGIYTTETGATIIAWVDDILLIGSAEEVQNMRTAICKRFTIKDLGNVKFFLSMLVERDRGRRVIHLSQRVYLEKILRRFRMDVCKGCATPMDVKTKLHTRREGEEAAEKVLYQEAVGSLTYAAITTRPDIAYATGLVGRFGADPSMLHWAAVKRIFRYLKDSLGLRICLGRSNDRGFGGRERGSKGKKAPITVYGDADFAGEVDGMRSTTGFVILDRYGAIVHWKSQRQKTVAKSTADAEFNATALAVEEGIWLDKLQAELYGNIENIVPISVFNDNQACIASLMNGQFRASTRHVGVRYFWLRELVREGEVTIEYLRTDEMIADGLTKGLERGKHQGFTRMLSMMS